MSEVTRIFDQMETGDPAAAAQLLPLVYDELRKLAAARLAHEQPGQTLQATALVHEAYLRLVARAGDGRQGTGDSESQHNPSPVPCSMSPASFNSRGHFFAAAAEAIRRILVEAARRKRQIKRGGELERLALDAIEPAEEARSDDLMALDEALTRLEKHDPLAAKIVKLRYFAGLSMPETAESLGISLRTAERNWTYARTWLHRELGSA